MFLSSLQKDRVVVIKQNGDRFEDQPASVQKNSIIMNGSKLLIEPGDLIERNMSNGGKETFKVIEPGWHERHGSIPAGYQMTVERLGLPKPAAAPQPVIYNITGHNARINNHSVDNSTNMVGVTDEVAELLTKLKAEIQTLGLEANERTDALEVVDAAEAQFAHGKPKKSVLTALLSALPAAGNIASIVGAVAALCQ
ncbi:MULTISPECIES: hypothetical protein [Paraburkholderia]|uniref:Uncharacterized protein n=1 Tax=Paraburkholderia madseniana TaxID=2599607 RepID=A0AAP5ET80_9BURK|nr:MULTISPECIES: hypothetical protein [Paraburkholderia]MCX4151985.1 hypothetical protein [Paraburkholderia madseniana]MCX4175596.1 hypothetical protein [Paraburkholderia madseniana]MDN7154913.1 hypothetical protein [Paraburkholderia sp. WS6]MDQ6413796.1 hypothetical protein [Paraburkholderia madseniana]MDQ6463592.1 hypothetical protein [Paraburkholderia madseniana]